jgi:two-component system phosphate regulon sensor histidine kinase PhoR
LEELQKLSYEKLYTLYEISKIINSTLNLRELLKIIIDSACKVLSAEAASVMLIDELENCLVFEVVEGEKEEKLKKIKIPKGVGIAGWVAKYGEPLIVNDVSKDERFYKKVDEETEFLTKSILCVPLKIKEKILGVIEVLNNTKKGYFDQEDEELLIGLANQAAIAIENAKLYEKLLEDKNYLDNILESTPEAVIVLDLKGNIMTFDKNAEIYFKRKEEEVTGKFYRDVLEEKFSNFLTELISRYNRGEKVIDYEYEVEIGDRIIPLGLTISFLKNQKNEIFGLIIIGRDLTETKQIINLTELNKMKSEFVSIASHELRTPLTSIKGFISTLISDTEGYFDEERKRRFYEIIDRETDRLIRLVNDLLDSARIEAGRALTMNWQEVELKPLVEKIINSQKAYTKKHTFDFEAEEIFFEADPDKMEQIVNNLLSNAVKYSPDGGKITVISKIISKEELFYLTKEKKIGEENWQFSSPEWVYFSVIDEGIGIPEEYLPKLFERFQRIDRKQQVSIKGTGIGLHLVKNLVELHKGKIWVESPVKDGKGSRFTFVIPKNKIEEVNL